MIHKIIHITLALSIFLSSGGFWMNNHFCQKKLTNTSFFMIFGACCSSDASPCSSEMEDMCCSDEESKDGCCDDEPSFHKLDQTQELKDVDFKSFERLIVLTTVIPVINIQLPSINKETLQFSNYTLPLIVYDRQVRLQTFRC